MRKGSEARKGWTRSSEPMLGSLSGHLLTWGEVSTHMAFLETASLALF